MRISIVTSMLLFLCLDSSSYSADRDSSPNESVLATKTLATHKEKDLPKQKETTPLSGHVSLGLETPFAVPPSPSLTFEEAQKSCLEICDSCIGNGAVWKTPEQLSFIDYSDKEILNAFRTILDAEEDQSLRPVFETLTAHLKAKKNVPDFTVLDIGYGWGELSSGLLKKYPQISRYYATDINKVVIQNVQQDSRIVAEIFDATQIETFPFKGTLFDVIVSVGAVCYFGEKQKQSIQDLSTLLKPGGVMILVDFLPFQDSEETGNYEIPRIHRFFAYVHLYRTHPEFQSIVKKMPGELWSTLFALAGTLRRPAYVHIKHKAC